LSIQRLGYGLDRLGFKSQGKEIFFLKMSRLALVPTQPAVQWAPSLVQNNQDVILTNDLQLVLRFRMNGAIPVPPQGQHYLSHTHQLQYIHYFYFIQSNHNLAKDISSLPTSLWVLDWESLQTVACNKYELQ
jgi:hypothetical protein